METIKSLPKFKEAMIGAADAYIIQARGAFFTRGARTALKFKMYLSSI